MERTRLPLALDLSSDDGTRTHESADDLSVAGTATLAQAEAQLVWRLAARMQADAARRLEDRSAQLARRTDDDAPALLPARFDRREVESIAQAAGIDPAFVALAWREVEADRLRPVVSDAAHDRASRFLGSAAERISVTATIAAAPEAVLEAMKRVLPADPYRLELAEVIGDSDRLTDASLLFDVPSMMTQMTQTGGYTPFAYAMSTADLKHVVLSLHDLGGGRTEVTATVDAKAGKLRNFTIGAWTTGILGAIGGALGLALSIGAYDGGAAALLGATLGTTVPGALTYVGYRAAYASGLKKGERALADLLKAIGVDARTGGVFGRPSAPPRRPGTDGGADLMVLTAV